MPEEPVTVRVELPGAEPTQPPWSPPPLYKPKTNWRVPAIIGVILAAAVVSFVWVDKPKTEVKGTTETKKEVKPPVVEPPRIALPDTGARR